MALLIVVATHLVFLPWALGAMRLWAQIPSLILSTISLILALWPRKVAIGAFAPATDPMIRTSDGQTISSSLPSIRASDHPASGDQPSAGAATPSSRGPESSVLGPGSSHGAQQRAVLLPYPKLLRFPIFWLGLALLALIAIQAWNPAWEYHTDGKVWWMQRIPYITWLPHGISGVPFEAPNAMPHGGQWRMFIIYASALLTACAVWIGFTRRRPLQWLLLTIAANGVALSVFGIGQRVLGWTKMFNFYDSPNPEFFASFVYKNHAGGYLLLMFAVATSLGAWYYVRGVRRMEKSSPAGFFALLVTCIGVALIVSYARSATLIMLGYLCITVLGFVWFQSRLPKAVRSPVITLAMLAIFGVFLATGLKALNSGLAWDKIRYAISGEDTSVVNRFIIARAALEMLHDSWHLGVGSGTFQFIFPSYQQHYPEIVHWRWLHAHDDTLELIIEFGVPGALLIFASLCWWIVQIVRFYGWENPVAAPILAGLLAVVAMSFGDFVFFCPAILVTWCTLWPICVRWALLEEARGSV